MLPALDRPRQHSTQFTQQLTQLGGVFAHYLRDVSVQLLLILDAQVLGRQNQHLNVAPFRTLTHLDQELEPVHLRHQQVQYDYVGTRFGELLQREAAIARSRDLPFLLLEHASHALAHDLIVVHQQELACDRTADVMQQADEPLAVDRLSHVFRRAERVAAAAVVLDGHQHHGNVCELWIALERRQHRPAIQVRHIDVERDRRGVKFARQLQAFPAPGCDANHESLALQIARHHLAYGLVVIDNQDERAFDRLHRPALRTHPAQERRRLDRLDAGGQADRECRALAQLALYGNLTAHHLAETAADRKSEPGATILARGRRIGLHEFLEQPAHLFGRHPDAGIPDGHRDLFAALAHEPRHVDGHNAMLGELVGVAHQIEQRL